MWYSFLRRDDDHESTEERKSITKNTWFITSEKGLIYTENFQ